MKLTLLELVVDILSDMDSDNVNSIDDTIESQQVAQIVKSSYYAMLSNRNWPHTRKLINLSSSLTLATPTHMYLPELVKELVFVNYDTHRDGDTRKLYTSMKYISPDAFLRRTNAYNDSAANVDVIQDPTGIQLLIRNDIPPTYYTSFDDTAIVFDAYDKAVDDTLQASKVQAMGYVTPGWSMVDSFIPDLPEEAFIALQEEAKSRAMFKLKQMVDQKAEQESSRQQRWLSRKAWRVAGGVQYGNYGRRSGKAYTNPTFKQGKQNG